MLPVDRNEKKPRINWPCTTSLQKTQLNNNNNNTLFTHATSRSDKNSLEHARETESIENKRNSVKLPF